ncbi:pectate lyase family protein [Fontivita pretiosa]|uniref:pectate lyase family protein n=1 Tax=Fontivita pretiosa TaxID=2989684 RepID=UPI003D1698AF
MKAICSWCGLLMVGWAATLTSAAQAPAFPGAEGFGAAANGGRGGSVYEVTNLDDSGPGSLRDAVSQGNRTIVFRVSGTINLTRRLEISKPNITIAGQTAPGDGICLRGKELFITNTSNIIVRFLRIRPGDELKQEHDALTIWNSHYVIVDHCSLSWSTDSLNDVVKGSGNVTLQWCILSEPLNASVHVKGAHGYGTGWDGRNGGSSFHHNLLAHCDSRAPRIGYFNVGRGLIDVRNNVIYNWGKLSGYGAEGDDVNYIGNYYRPGPNSRNTDIFFEIWRNDAKMYVAGNFMEGMDQINRDNARGVRYRKDIGEVDPGGWQAASPFAVAAVTTQSAQDAYQAVLAAAGAILPRRDAVDQRIIQDVKNRTGRIINSQDEVGGWPELKSDPAPVDSDHDGMPDAWESANRLDPNDPSDGPRLSESGYSNLELYLNSLVRIGTVDASP